MWSHVHAQRETNTITSINGNKTQSNRHIKRGETTDIDAQTHTERER